MFSRTTRHTASEVVIFAGPHASGKDTLEELFRRSNARATRLVRYSTRRKAPGEENGVTYHFISGAEFRQMSKKGDFAEEAHYPEGSTGTALSDIVARLRQYRYVCLTMNLEDALKLKGALDGIAVSNRCLFIGPCTERVMIDDPGRYTEILSARMLARRRGTDDLALRLRKARLYREMYLAHRGKITYIANEDGKQAAALRQIKRALRG
jgi:guanylate kinase